MKKAIPILALLVGAVVIVLAFVYLQDDDVTYETYTNQRYQYQIKYPSTFAPQGESQNGDGQVFEGENASLRVFGTQNVADSTLRQIAEGYINATGESLVLDEEAPYGVTLRAEQDDIVQATRAISLAGQAVGVAVLRYQEGALDDDVDAFILESFHNISTGDEMPAPSDGDVNGETTDEEPEVIGYRTYRSPNLGFAMMVPTEANILGSDGSRVQFKFLGPGNEIGTEITDGFTLTAYRDALDTEYSSVLAYAQAVVNETRSGSQNAITKGLEQRTVSGMTAYRYSYIGALGDEVTEYVFLANEGRTGYRMTYNVSDPDNKGYQGIVFTMLESVQFSTP